MDLRDFTLLKSLVVMGILFQALHRAQIAKSSTQTSGELL
jgi:hypothetical protein